MKPFFLHILFFIGSIAACMGLASCTDSMEGVDDFDENGVSTVTFDLSFKAFDPVAVGTRSPGDATKYIEQLWFVIYKADDGTFVEKRKIADGEMNVTINKRPDDAPSSETETGHAEVSLTLNNGRYKIYAVANLDMTDIADEKINTIEKLKAYPLHWDTTPIAEGKHSPNSQMLGGFKSVSKDENPDSEAQEIIIGYAAAKYHAWLTRAASKVTIAFDTRKLSNDVELYLQSVAIKDIPAYCPLGFDNSPGQNDQESYKHNDLTEAQRNELINEGEVIYLATAGKDDVAKQDYGKWKRIAAGDTIYGLYSETHPKEKWMPYEKRWQLEHSEAAPALYFFENIQPDGVEGTVTDKRQDVNGNNSQVSFPNGNKPEGEGWKDGMPYGTYIEVKGYYVNSGTARPGQGPITYRFMLGKDTKTNYDCERNHHYMLTMMFNGYANDVDFHIDYEEEARPGLHVQDTTYVSYLYNQQSHTTIRATPREGYDVLSLEAYILDNEWRPHDVADDKKKDSYNEEAWTWQQNYTDLYKKNTNGYTRPDDQIKVRVKHFDNSEKEYIPANNIEFGYLALRKTRQNQYDLDGGKNEAFIAKMRRLFFDSNPKSSNTGSDSYNKNNSKGYRNYGTMPSEDGTKTTIDDTDGNYSVVRRTNLNNHTVDYVMQVPLYTRARSIDSWAVYSGANPFYRHHRYARVGFVATYKKIDNSKPGPDTYQDYGETTVLQARRIDNPRGIYRKRENKEPFHVLLCYNMKNATEQQETVIGDDEIIYDDVISRTGGWTVSIENDPHNLIQITANNKTITGQGSSIAGKTNTPIEFTYTPRVSPEEGDAYGGTIFITYHNNSCSHRIIVRQGYDAHELTENSKVLWSTFNVYDKNNLTRSPLSVGSVFRKVDDLSYPIKESNNTRTGYGVSPLCENGTEGSALTLPGALWIHGQSDTKWASIPSMTNVPTGKGSYSWMLHNVLHNKDFTYRLPDYTEIADIGIQKDNDNTTDLTVGQAFGICYADGAKGVIKTKGAYSYYDPDNKGEDSDKGVRGVVVYNQKTADNLFFPFGALGHARRRRNGILQYGSVNWRLKGGANNYRPMAYDLIHQVGGVYWMTGSDAKNHAAIDYNGGNYMSSYLNHVDVFQTDYDNNAKTGKSDALMIRPVREKGSK